MDRRCKACGEPLGVDDDVCRSCGATNEIKHPWYIWPIGFLIVAVLVALLVDTDVWMGYFEGFSQ